MVSKLDDLDKIEKKINDLINTISKLTDTAQELLFDYPGKEIPKELKSSQDMVQCIEHKIGIEREKLLQSLELSEEYEQTLNEFSQITKIAKNLLDCPVSVTSLSHLQDEMQKHRKFFVNLNHCKSILESLENNLDPHSLAKYQEFHKKLHNEAISLLDEASTKAQHMSLAASRWVVLEQGIKEENGWLQVAQQRIPDLRNVTSTEYNQYISLYQVIKFFFF